MPAHIHAENMRLYAEDAAETETPWTRWQVKSAGTTWVACTCYPSWREENEYRRKPRTININGHEVPEPCRERLVIDQRYWMPSILDVNDPRMGCWNYNVMHIERLSNGIVHLTREAAIAHAKALLSFTASQP